MSIETTVNPLTKIPFIARCLKYASRTPHQLIRATHVTSTWEETILQHETGKVIFDNLDKSRDCMIQLFVSQIRDGLTAEQKREMKEAIDHNPEKFIAASLAGLPTTVDKIFAIPIEDAAPFVDSTLQEMTGCGVPFFAFQLIEMAIHLDLDHLFKILVFDFEAASPTRCDDYGVKSFYTAMFSQVITNRSEKIMNSFFLNLADPTAKPNEYQEFFFGNSQNEECKILWDAAPPGEILHRKQFDSSAKESVKRQAKFEKTPFYEAVFHSYPRTKPANFKAGANPFDTAYLRCWFEAIHALLLLKYPNGQYVLKLNNNEYKIFSELLRAHDFDTTKALLQKEPRLVEMLTEEMFQTLPNNSSNSSPSSFSNSLSYETRINELYLLTLQSVGVDTGVQWKEDKSAWREGVTPERLKIRTDFVKLWLSLGAKPFEATKRIRNVTNTAIPEYYLLDPDMNYTDNKCMVCSKEFESGFFSSSKKATCCSLCGLCAHEACLDPKKLKVARPQHQKQGFFGKLRSDDVEISICKECAGNSKK